MSSSQIPQTVEAGDFLTSVQNIVTRVEDLIPAVAILAVGIAVVMVYMKSRALVPTLVALLIGGLVVWGISDVTWFSNGVGGVFTNSGAPAPAPHDLIAHLTAGRSA
jgi:hypothetical protein